MNYEPEKATPAIAFSLRIKEELYDALHEYCFKTGDSKNKILNMALENFLKEQSAN